MKLKTMILLGGLLLGQTIAIPINASNTEMFSLEFQRKRHKAYVAKHKEHERGRSASLFISGYVEDNILVLSFSIPLRTAQLRVVDSETGNVVFEGTASGNSLSIPLERDAENFEVYIN